MCYAQTVERTAGMEVICESISIFIITKNSPKGVSYTLPKEFSVEVSALSLYQQPLQEGRAIGISKITNSNLACIFIIPQKLPGGSLLR